MAATSTPGSRRAGGAASWWPFVVGVVAVLVASLLVWRLVSGPELSAEDSWGAISAESKLVTASQDLTITVTYQDDSALPDWLAGQRAVVDVDGTVEAYVDLRAIEPNDVSVDGGTVTVVLPPIEYSKPSISNIDWKVDDRGLFDRVSDFFESDDDFRNQVIERLNEELVAEAEGSADLEAEAQRNAKDALERILVPAGAERVVVRFEEADAPRPPG